MNSKITHIEFKNEWAGTNGTVYYHNIAFENGESGQIGTKTKLPEKLQVGKFLDYEITTDEKGNKKVKAIQLPNNVKKGFHDPEAEALRQRMIIAQSSISSAVQFYQQRQGGIDEVKKMGKELYDFVIEISK